MVSELKELTKSREEYLCLAFKVFQLFAPPTFLTVTQRTLHSLCSAQPQTLKGAIPPTWNALSLSHLSWFVSAFPLAVTSSIFSLGNSLFSSLGRILLLLHLFASPSKISPRFDLVFV